MYIHLSFTAFPVNVVKKTQKYDNLCLKEFKLVERQDKDTYMQPVEDRQATKSAS